MTPISDTKKIQRPAADEADVTPYSKKYPRGHAYIEIRNGGLFTRMDFPAKAIPLLEEIRKDAMNRIMAKWREENSATQTCPNEQQPEEETK